MEHRVCAIYTSPYQRALETIAPLAERLELPVYLEPGLQERRLGRFSSGDFLQAVEATWHDPCFAHPSGETNAAAQQRGLEVVRRLREQHDGEHVVLSTHGNLMALVMQTFDAAIDYAFWQSLSMPDIYSLDFSQAGKPMIERLWQ
jgi:2,3-bisphosphoglycerate-dependent phosphoglycerate mutase